MDLSIVSNLCVRFEGFRAKPYTCPAGVATVGFGSTHYSDGRKVTLQDAPISEPVAHALLLTELFNTYAPGVLRQCPGLLPLSLLENDWRKLNAIVDFAYNLGVGRLQTSTLRRKINAGDWEGAQSELKKWVRGGGRILPGLVTRRAAEVQLLNP